MSCSLPRALRVTPRSCGGPRPPRTLLDLPSHRSSRSARIYCTDELHRRFSQCADAPGQFRMGRSRHRTSAFRGHGHAITGRDDLAVTRSRASAGHGSRSRTPVGYPSSPAPTPPSRARRDGSPAGLPLAWSALPLVEGDNANADRLDLDSSDRSSESRGPLQRIDGGDRARIVAIPRRAARSAGRGDSRAISACTTRSIGRRDHAGRGRSAAAGRAGRLVHDI